MAVDAGATAPTLSLAQPDPIGDTAHFPLDDAALVAKLDGLLAPGDGDRLLAAVRRLPATPDVVAGGAGLARVAAG